MNQSQSADLSAKLAKAWAGWNGNQDAHESRGLEESVQLATFNQCFGFIPENALAAIIEEPEESPFLAALDSDRLYLLSVNKPGEGERPGTTDCELKLVEPKQSAVACRTTFYGKRVNADPIRRETTWAFVLGDRELSLTTQVSPEVPFPPEEEFAQALAGLIGWTQFPVDEKPV